MKKNLLNLLILLLSIQACQVKFPDTIVATKSNTKQSVTQEGYLGQLEFKKILAGEKSNIYNYEVRTIQNEVELQTLWEDYAGNEVNLSFLPKIDFQQKNLIAVFLGKRETTGFKIDIDNIEEQKDNILVHLKEVEPTNGIEFKDEETQPFLFIELKKSTKKILFDKTQIKNSTIENLPFQLVEKGTDSGITNFSKIIAEDNEGFYNLYKKHLLGKKETVYSDFPEIDFRKNIAVGIFLGYRDSKNYSFEISEVVKSNKFITIKSKEYFNGEINKDKAETYPYQIISIPKTNLPIKFETTLINTTKTSINKNLTVKPISIKTFLNGSNSKIKEKKSLIIKDSDAFRQLWKEHSDTQPPPSIDFIDYNLLAVFSGNTPKTGISIKINDVIETDNDIKVFVNIITNVSEARLLSNNPYEMVLMPKTSKKIVFINNNIEI